MPMKLRVPVPRTRSFYPAHRVAGTNLHLKSTIILDYYLARLSTPSGAQPFVRQTTFASSRAFETILTHGDSLNS